MRAQDRYGNKPAETLSRERSDHKTNKQEIAPCEPSHCHPPLVTLSAKKVFIWLPPRCLNRRQRSSPDLNCAPVSGVHSEKCRCGRPRKIIEQTIITCVPTLPLRRRAATGFVLFSFSAVGVLKRRGDLRGDCCVFWQRASWQYRPSALGKNLQTRPSWCLSVHTKNSSRPPHLVLPALTGNKRHLRTSTRLGASAPRRWKKQKKKKKKDPRPKHPALVTPRSSFVSSSSHCSSDGEMFLCRWQTERLRVSPGYFDRSGKKEELLENVELWEKHSAERERERERITEAFCKYWNHTYYDYKYRGPYVRTKASVSSFVFWVLVRQLGVCISCSYQIKRKLVTNYFDDL